MAQFLERYKLLKFTQGITDYLNRPISMGKIQSIINNLPKKEVLRGQDIWLMNRNLHMAHDEKVV